ncbi:MAG TPA: radical SAM protein [Ignavibacteriaceae bacterium]|nr:radical SAM protein [Ignavibacteriaceae bacterium]
MSILFGPIPSRRLGRSLGINNIPPKVCSYSCVYCQVGLTTKLSIERKTFYSPMIIYTDVKERLDELKLNNEIVDYLSFVPDGEPTLDVNLAESIQLLQDFGIKIAVFTNSSLIWKREVQDALRLADYVSIKVDTTDEVTWRKINRPSPKLNLSKILDGILEFKEIYSGKLVTETMLIDGINDNEDDLIKIAHFIVKVEPEIAYLTIPTRPTPFKDIHSPLKEKTISIFKIFESIYPNTELLNAYEGTEFSTVGETEKALVSIMAVHPMRKDAVETYLFNSNSNWDLIKKLINEEKIKELEYDGNTFYKKN